jgi:hypothetical protein
MGGAGCEAGAYAKTKKGRRRDAVDLFPVTCRASSPGAVAGTPPTRYSACAAYWGPSGLLLPKHLTGVLFWLANELLCEARSFVDFDQGRTALTFR